MALQPCRNLVFTYNIVTNLAPKGSTVNRLPRIIIHNILFYFMLQQELGCMREPATGCDVKLKELF